MWTKTLQARQRESESVSLLPMSRAVNAHAMAINNTATALRWNAKIRAFLFANVSPSFGKMYPRASTRRKAQSSDNSRVTVEFRVLGNRAKARKEPLTPLSSHVETSLLRDC